MSPEMIEEPHHQQGQDIRRKEGGNANHLHVNAEGLDQALSRRRSSGSSSSSSRRITIENGSLKTGYNELEEIDDRKPSAADRIGTSVSSFDRGVDTLSEDVESTMNVRQRRILSRRFSISMESLPPSKNIESLLHQNKAYANNVSVSFTAAMARPFESNNASENDDDEVDEEQMNRELKDFFERFETSLENDYTNATSNRSSDFEPDSLYR